MSSTLGNTALGDSSVDNSTPDPASITPQPSAQTPTQAPPAQGGSRLARIVQAVANVASTALIGIPDQGRPSFVTGLGEGARAEKAEVANQQAIKFRNFDDQLRLATLHNQDIKLQNDTQAQTDAHKKAELDNRALAESMGIDYDTLPSHGPTVMDHLTAQTAANGAASVPPGTHLSGDGETINIPKDTQATRDGQKQMYNVLAPALGLPSLPEGAQFVPSKNMNMLTNKIHGFDLGGNPIKHDDLPGMIGATQAQRDNLAKNGGTQAQLQAVDNVLGIYKANLKALDDHSEDVRKQQKQGDLDVENNPDNQAAAARGAGLKTAATEKASLPYKIALQNNAAKDKNDSTELNAVAFDPTYKNADGTLGANVVMSKADASAKGLSHYKADPAKLNAVVAGFNDVQNKINMLADVAADPKKMTQVQGPTAAQLLKQGFGLEVGAFGTKVDLSNINTAAYEAQLKWANQATRDYVTAMAAAHEAITQLPRLQTFGQSSRMTEKQMEAAQNMLPHPGDDAGMASQKMQALQTTIDPLRKQVPHMPGAEQIPSWLEQRKQRVSQSGGSRLGQVASGGNAIDFVNQLMSGK